MVKIKGRLEEQEHHSGNQPVLKGILTIDGKECAVAGWVYYNKEGTITVSIENTVIKEKPNGQSEEQQEKDSF